jgi:dTDP-glucose 4,6-dehydratase
VSILVTGAAGFIGKNFVQQYSGVWLSGMYYVDKLSEQSDLEFWNSLDDDRKFHMDIKDIDTFMLEKLNIKYIVNFAAESHVDRSIEGPLAFTLSNVVSTHMLLEACKQYGRLIKFVQVGTDEVYGTLGEDDYPFTELSNIAPNSPYSASKAAQDLIARSYYETYKLPVVITRCSNNYGTGQNKEKLIPKVIDCLVNNKDIPVYGNGLNVRDWIHVDDHCYGVFLATTLGVPGHVYNIGGDNEVCNIDVINSLCDIYEELTSENRSGNIKFVEDRKGHDLRYAINAWKAKVDLGFKPERSGDFHKTLEELLAEELNKRKV